MSHYIKSSHAVILRPDSKRQDIILENTFPHPKSASGVSGAARFYCQRRAGRKSHGLDDNQGMFMARELCSDFLDLPLTKIRVMPVEVGGALGGKNLQPLAPLCALLSIKSGRPVKMVMTKAEDFTDNRPAPAATITIKLGADKEGHLTAAEATFIYDNGAFSG